MLGKKKIRYTKKWQILVALLLGVQSWGFLIGNEIPLLTLTE